MPDRRSPTVICPRPQAFDDAVLRDKLPRRRLELRLQLVDDAGCGLFDGAQDKIVEVIVPARSGRFT